jgi:hypothetical protein
MRKLIVGLVALAILVGAGILVAGKLRADAFRLAEAERDACYANQGYFLGGGQTIPDEVRNACTRSMSAFFDGETMRYVYGGLAGLTGALVFLLLAWFLVFRRGPGGAGA